MCLKFYQEMKPLASESTDYTFLYGLVGSTYQRRNTHMVFLLVQAQPASLI